MSTKTSGAEFKKFYSDKLLWEDGTYHEDEEITIDGTVIDSNEHDLLFLSDNARVTLSGGYVKTDDGMDLGSFESYFKKWRREQDTVVLLVTVKKEALKAVKVAIINAGGAITSSPKAG